MSGTHRLGRYEVVEHLASGGMGSVYLARATGPAGFERHVVVKMLDTPDNDDALAMFFDEARVLGRMHHQHIALAYELDQDDGRYFLVMDYIHGQTVKAVWDRTLELGLVLPLNFTLTVVVAAASALHYAHTLRSNDGAPLRIVHRDVSPSNLMVGYDGSIKLIDFGIAKASRRISSTQVGLVKGNLSYMAPEQVGGRALDHRTDVFALGAVLYELVTMTRAFRGKSDLETVTRIKHGAIEPPSQVMPAIAPELEQIILCALQADPATRFQDADAMRRALEVHARRENIALGDSAVIKVMEVLFEHRREPWVIADEDTTEPIVVHEIKRRRKTLDAGDASNESTSRGFEPTPIPSGAAKVARRARAM
jgi:eukaryotic-like serine/threonine-protein kinase